MEYHPLIIPSISIRYDVIAEDMRALISVAILLCFIVYNVIVLVKCKRGKKDVSKSITCFIFMVIINYILVLLISLFVGTADEMYRDVQMIAIIGTLVIGIMINVIFTTLIRRPLKNKGEDEKNV